MKLDVNVLLRNPEYPVIVFSGTKLFSAKNLKILCETISMIYESENDEIKIIDTSMDVFSFYESTNSYIIIPAFLPEKISKKYIVEKLNCYLGIKYKKNIATIRVPEFIKDVCTIIDNHHKNIK